jgi:hypothetical protein
MSDRIDRDEAGSFDDGQEELFDLDPEPTSHFGRESEIVSR